MDNPVTDPNVQPAAGQPATDAPGVTTPTDTGVPAGTDTTPPVEPQPEADRPLDKTTPTVPPVESPTPTTGEEQTPGEVPVSTPAADATGTV